MIYLNTENIHELRNMRSFRYEHENQNDFYLLISIPYRNQ